MNLTYTFRALSRLVNRKLALTALCILALGVMSASPFTPTASAYYKLEIKLDPTLTQETTGNGNGILEPGETGTLKFRVRNHGYNPVHATLVRVRSDELYINDYTSDAYWEGGEELIFFVNVEVPCSTGYGYTANVKLAINWHVPFGNSGLDSDTGSLRIEEQDIGHANFYGYYWPPVAIPDNDANGVDIPLEIDTFARITDLEFIIHGSACDGNSGSSDVGLEHAKVSDLVIKLTSPEGTTVTLIDRPGGSTNTGSNFCNTVLDDNQLNPLIQSITTGGAPYSGTFEPANPLSAFIGENLYGTWTLNVSDQAATNTGLVKGFSLMIIDDSSSCDFLPGSNISGRVTTDGTTGLPDVMMKVVRQLPDNSESETVPTDANGNYVSGGWPHRGSYTVTPHKLGYRFNPVERYFSVLDTDSVADFKATEANYSISGRVLRVGSTSGLSGVTMNLTGDRDASVTTDANGSYTFPDLPASGNYMLTPSLIGYKITPASLSYLDLSADQTNQNFVARVQTYTVSGVVRLGTARLSGVTITLNSPTPDGFPTRSTITSSTGAYSLSGLPAGRNYTLTPTKPGFQFNPPNKSVTSLSANQTVNFAVKVYSISGRIKRTGATSPLTGITVTATSPSPSGFTDSRARTDNDGYYTLWNLPAGRDYAIIPSRSGFTFTPPHRSIRNLRNDISPGAATSFTGTGP